VKRRKEVARKKEKTKKERLVVKGICNQLE